MKMCETKSTIIANCYIYIYKYSVSIYKLIEQQQFVTLVSGQVESFSQFLEI